MADTPEDEDLLLSILQDDIRPSPRNTAASPVEHPDMAQAQRAWSDRTEPVPPFRDILWAYDHLEADFPSPLQCPTRGAWALLEFGRGNPKDFLTRLLPQATVELERRRQERLAREREADEEEKLRKAAKAKEEKPPLPESEAKAIADIRQILASAVEESADGGV